MLTTEAGKIAWQAQLDVYGVVREEALTAGGLGADAAPEAERTSNPWRYPGQYEDAETGPYYNRFRYYDPEIGRYLSEDPIGLAGGEALYGYVPSPAWWIDPFGLTGTYFFTDGKSYYIGKGPYERMLQSMRERIGGSGNAIKSAYHDFGNSKMGLMVEHELMEMQYAVKLGHYANRIKSPGKSLLEKASPATKKLVKAWANKIKRRFQDSKGLCAK